MTTAVPRAENRVCVTGGNGFIGSWLVQTLLEKGYAVTVTFQPGTDPSHLLAFPGADGGRLLLRMADLLDAASIANAVDGCRAGVFHVASPCTLEDPQDPERELLMPAVIGTLNVLEAARAAGSRRVVLTSSISAMVPNPRWATDQPGRTVDEDCWTDLDYCKARQKWYPVSKTMAEKRAWEYAEKYGLDIVAINPSTCLGPLLQPGLNASSAVLQQLLQGSKDTKSITGWAVCMCVILLPLRSCYWRRQMHLGCTYVPMGYISSRISPKLLQGCALNMMSIGLRKKLNRGLLHARMQLRG